MPIATGRTVLLNRDANKLKPEDRAVHEWYRFVLSFPPHLVRDYLSILGIERGERVLDPFAGTGTTLVEVKKAGFVCAGLESHPMGHFASTVKTDWSINAEQLVEQAERVVNAAMDAAGEPIMEQELLVLHSASPLPEHLLARLDLEQEKLLLAQSISPRPLHKILALRDAITQMAEPSLQAHMRLALAKTAVTDASNLHFGPEVGLGEVKEDAPVFESWLSRIFTMANDIEFVAKPGVLPAQVIRADARQAGESLPARSVDVVITSPPYPNEKDYTRTTRLETVLLGFISSKKDLRELKEGLIRSNTRNIYKDDDDDQSVLQFKSVQRIAAEIEARRLALGKTSGFERLYHRVTKHYFGGVARHLASIQKVLKPGARLAYVVGDQASFFRIKIHTGNILAEIAEHLGYKVEGIDLFRTRMATATRSTLREEVVRLSWNIP